MATVYLDESGYTGQDLYNVEQPFFVIASLKADASECIDIKAKYFENVQAKELKHSSLAKSKSQQQMVINFVKNEIITRGNIKVSVAHKRYVLMCKIVDLLIEPAAHADGIDLYERGGNIGLTNIMFLGLPVATSKAYFDSLLEKFQVMIRNRSTDSYNNFFGHVLTRQQIPVAEQLLTFIRGAHFRLGQKGLLDLPENALDIAFSMALLMMGQWRKELPESIALIHDMSSNMSKQQDIWNALTSHEVPPALIGYDRRTMQFPVALEETKFESSTESVGLQLTDVVAGVFARIASWYFGKQDPNDDYAKNLINMLGDYPILPLLPEKAFTPEELKTTGGKAINPNNFLGNIVRDTIRKTGSNRVE